MEKGSSYSLISEMVCREHGLSGDRQSSLRSGSSNGFDKRFCASRHVIQNLKHLHSMNTSRGIYSYFNSVLNFNRQGNFLCCTSPPLVESKVQVWDWGLNKLNFSYRSCRARAQIFDLEFI